MNIIRKIKELLTKILLRIRYQLNFIEEKSFYKRLSDVGINTEKIHFSAPRYICGEKYMSFKGSFYSSPGARIECIDSYHGQQFHPHLEIGDGTSFNFYCHIGVINEVIIGDNVLLGSRVLITDHQHGELSEEQRDIPWADRPLISKGPVHIEDNVWLGENVCVMPGVTIGRGSVVGANSVVTHDIPPYSMAVGIPARVIKSLKSE